MIDKHRYFLPLNVIILVQEIKWRIKRILRMKSIVLCETKLISNANIFLRLTIYFTTDNLFFVLNYSYLRQRLDIFINVVPSNGFIVVWYSQSISHGYIGVGQDQRCIVPKIFKGRRFFAFRNKVRSDRFLIYVSLSFIVVPVKKQNIFELKSFYLAMY